MCKATVWATLQILHHHHHHGSTQRPLLARLASIMAADRPCISPSALAGIGMPTPDSLAHTHTHSSTSHTLVPMRLYLCHAPTTWVTSSRPGQEAVRASTYTTHAWPEMRPLPSRDNQRSIPVPGWRRPSNICKKQEIDEDRQKTTKGTRSSQACVRACASSAHVVIEGQRKRACRKIESHRTRSQTINTRHKTQSFNWALSGPRDSALFRSDLIWNMDAVAWCSFRV